jgi:chlorobactene glucosyltransferase
MSWFIAALPVLTLLVAVLNRFAWPRGGRGSVEGIDVSVLIPARNEAENLEPLLRSLARQSVPVKEIIVYDDASTDGTAELLERLRSEITGLRVLTGCGLPAGWVGKPHACHRLASAARGKTLLFVDADVRLRPEGIERIHRVRGRLNASLVTAVPQQEVVTWMERLVVPLLHLTYMAWLPVPLIWRSRDPRFLAANGQMLLVTRDAYDRVGGFSAVKDAIVDDMAFCRLMKTSGERVAFADGHDMAVCRMYRSASEVWSGFSKNLYLGIGASAARLGFVLAMNATTFVLPFVAVLFPLGIAPVPVAVAAIAVILTSTLVAGRHRYPVLTPLLVPFGVVALIAIGLNSFRWHLAGRVQWRDRVYGSALSSSEITP